MFEYDNDLLDLISYIDQRVDLNHYQCLQLALDTIYTNEPYYDDEGYLLTPPIDCINDVNIHIRLTRKEFTGIDSVLYGTDYSYIYTEYVFMKDGKEVIKYYLARGTYKNIYGSLKKIIEDSLLNTL